MATDSTPLPMQILTLPTHFSSHYQYLHPFNLPRGSTMFLETSSANIDLSRSRLRHLTTWIRDDLDLKVAREGPDVLRPDDVLILHETFLALPYATHITAMDLRATGIYKAIQDISGVATRWPGQLCDDCDKIISLWTTRFGPLSDLHPFLYGRGGRLESIATVTDYSKEVSLGAALICT